MYVNDLVIVGMTKEPVKTLKTYITTKCEFKDLDELDETLIKDVAFTIDGNLFLSQSRC